MCTHVRRSVHDAAAQRISMHLRFESGQHIRQGPSATRHRLKQLHSNEGHENVQLIASPALAEDLVSSHRSISYTPTASGVVLPWSSTNSDIVVPLMALHINVPALADVTSTSTKAPTRTPPTHAGDSGGGKTALLKLQVRPVQREGSRLEGPSTRTMCRRPNSDAFLAVRPCNNTSSRRSGP